MRRDRIRLLRDGEKRRFGRCSHCWMRWKRQPNGSRTTSDSCADRLLSDHTIGINGRTLQINSASPAMTGNGQGSWDAWRLPQPGRKELMVATQCASARAMPPAPPERPSRRHPALKRACSLGRAREETMGTTVRGLG